MELPKVNKNHSVLGHFLLMGSWIDDPLDPKNEPSITELLKVDKTIVFWDTFLVGGWIVDPPDPNK